MYMGKNVILLPAVVIGRGACPMSPVARAVRHSDWSMAAALLGGYLTGRLTPKRAVIFAASLQLADVSQGLANGPTHPLHARCPATLGPFSAA